MFTSLLLLANSLSGVFLYPQEIFAQETTNLVEQEEVEKKEVYSTSELEPSVTPEVIQSDEVENAEKEKFLKQLSSTKDSAGVLTPESEEEILEEGATTSASIVTEAGLTPAQESGESASLTASLWIENEDGSITTREPVGEGIEYGFKDTQVKVVFTKITTPGLLTIREFDPENAEELGILGKAYEITSDMQDGTFEYDLTLPLPAEANEDLAVKYAENPGELANAQPVNEPTKVIDNTITIRGLTHFTVFVVVPNPSPPPESFLEIIIDNEDPEFSILSGSWRDSTSVPGWYGSDYKTTDERTGTEQVEWSFQVKESGHHEVYAWWTAHPNRGTAVPYTINYEGGSDTVFVDQEQNGGQWNLLGTYDFNAGVDYSVVLTNNATDSNDYVIADAIKVKSIEAPSEVWVDDDWAGSSNGDIVGDGKVFGYNAFATIQEGIDAVQGSTVYIAPGIYNEGPQIVIDKDVSLVGAGMFDTILRPTADTGSSGDSRGWFLVEDDVEFDLSDLTMDGTGFKIYQAIRHRGKGTISNVAFTNIKFNESGPNYAGFGVVAYGNGPVDVHSSQFSGIGRVGVLYFGSGVNGSIFDGSTYVGKGSGDWLDYGVEVGAGAQVTISNSMISNNKGVASVDGSTSAGILVTTYFGTGTQANIVGNKISDSTAGVAIGYDSSDSSDVTLAGNDINNNEIGVEVSSPATTISAYQNSFSNSVNVVDPGARNWDNGIIGNTWSDYTGVDLDNDRIGETPYIIDEDSQDRYPIADYLSAQVTLVTTNKNYYKEGDSLEIEVQVTNDGDLVLDPTKEKLTVNIKGPDGWISGSFREQQGLSLAPGESGIFTFYTSPQTIPGGWGEGSYTVYTSIYSTRANPLGYLPGGQSSDTQFIVDNTDPVTNDPLDSPLDNSFWNEPIQILGTSTDNFWTELLNLFYRPAGSSDPWEDGYITTLSNPENDDVFDWSYFWTPDDEGTFDIKAVAVDAAGNEESSAIVENVTYDVTPPATSTGMTIKQNGNDLGCGAVVNERTITVDWNDNTEPDLDYYEYQVQDNGWTTTVDISERTGDIRDQDGTYAYRVRAYDSAGNASNWTDWCSVTLDREGPAAPSITFPGPEEYFNSTPILNQWSAVTDSSGIDYYRIQYEYDDGHTFPGYPYRTTTNTWRSHTPGIGEQGGVRFRVQAFDNAGNEGEWSDWRHYFYDIEAPGVPTSLSIANGTETSDTTPTLTWEQPSDNLDPYGINNKPGFNNYRVQVADNLEFVSPEKDYYTDNTSYTPILTEGTWYWRVKARDDAGNWSDWSEVWQFTVDTTAPQSFFIFPENEAIFGGPEGDPINIEGYSTDEPVNTVAYTNLYYRESQSEDDWRLIGTFENSQENEPFYWDTEWTPEEDGIYDFKAEAVDKAGNVEETAYLFGVIYDTTPPTVIWNSPNNGDTLIGVVPIDIDANDNLSGVNTTEVFFASTAGGVKTKITGNSWDTGAPLALGEYDLIARVTDMAGNESEEIIQVGVAAIVSNESSTTPTQTTAVITWVTDRPTSSRVVYDTVPHYSLGPPPNYGYAYSTGTFDTDPKVTNHTVTITGLSDGTIYYYRTISEGSPTTVGNQYLFKTLTYAGAPSGGGGGGGAGTVQGLTTTVLTTTSSISGDVEGASSEEGQGEEIEEVLGEEIEATPTPEKGETQETGVASIRAVRVIVWIVLVGSILFMIYFLFFRKERRQK